MTQELRRLAEAYPMEYDPMGKSGKENLQRCLNYNAFHAAANPAAILSLLDRLEKAEKDAARLVWAMNWMLTSAHDYGFLKHVLERGGTGDYSDCVTYIDAAMEASK